MLLMLSFDLRRFKFWCNPIYLHLLLLTLLVSHPRNRCQIQCHEAFFTLMFSSKSGMVLGLMFKSFIHFAFIFGCSARWGPTFILLHVVYRHWLLKKLTFSPLNGLGNLVENCWSIYVRIYFWAVCSISLFCLSLCQYHTVLIIVALYYILTSRINFPLLFQDSFGYLASFKILY